MKKQIYMDHAATTPVDKQVLKEMLPFFDKKYGNASSLHSFGREAREAVDLSRQRVAHLINADPEEIYFTSGGTESNNLALKGLAFKKKGHIITTKIEHHCVLHAAEWLSKQGIDVTYINVDKHGIVNLTELEHSIRKDTFLISIMFANNEIGTIQPIEEISKICKKHNILLHTDAVQAIGKVPIDVKKLGIDMLTISAHKLYGPKGVGCLYVRKNTTLEPILHGGGHESGLRSGTENVPGIVGFGKACQLAEKDLKKEIPRLKELRDYMIKNVLKIKNSWLNGHATQRLPHNANFGFDFIEGESIVMLLDNDGIAASTGSACSSTSLEPSHVLLAIGLPHEKAHGSLRLTLGKQNTKSDVDYLISKLPGIIKKLREYSPLGDKQ